MLVYQRVYIYIYVYVYTVYSTIYIVHRNGGYLATEYENAKQHLLLCIHSSVNVTFPKCFGYIYIWVCPQTVHPPKWWFICNVIGVPPIFIIFTQSYMSCVYLFYSLVDVITCFQHFPTEQCSKHFKTLCIQFYTLVIWLSSWWLTGFPLWTVIIPKYS